MPWHNDYTISFKSVHGDFSISTPVAAARDIKPYWLSKQERSPAEKRFQRCPGMLDYSRMGYLITAYTDIHIKANGQGTFIEMKAKPNPGFKASKFDRDLVDGVFKTEGVRFETSKIPMPWSVRTMPGYSGIVLPATYHSDFLDKIAIYPGVIDLDTFVQVNMVFTVLKPCEFTIWAGTPLLQVIPFKREKITAVCGKASMKEMDYFNFSFPSSLNNYYKKYLSGKKVYTMDSEYSHRTIKKKEEV